MKIILQIFSSLPSQDNVLVDKMDVSMTQLPKTNVLICVGASSPPRKSNFSLIIFFPSRQTLRKLTSAKVLLLS